MIRRILTPETRNMIATSISLIVLAVMLVALVWLVVRAYNLTNIHQLAELIVGWGLWGPFVLILLTAVGALTGVIATTPLAVLAGAIWGVWLGTVYMVIGVQLGAVLAFLISRNAVFPWLDRFFKRHMSFYTRMNDTYITRFIFISRLFPIFIFEIISYGAGLTRISFWNYFWATLIGIIPTLVLFSWSGTAVLDAGGPFIWVLTALAMASMIGFPWVVERYNPWNLRDRLLSEDSKKSQ